MKILTLHRLKYLLLMCLTLGIKNGRGTLVKDKRNAYRIFTETAKRKRPPGRPERRRVTNTPDFKPRNSSERIHLARDRDKWRAVVRTIMNLRGQ